MSVTVRAAAKINLHLGVGAVREDGFHPLATVYQAIGLYDDLTATEASAWEVHTIADDGIDLALVPDDDSNIAIRAGQALAAHHGLVGDAARCAHLEIHKGIPVAGGMAGGSADAAAALVALDRLWGLETSDDDLLAIAATLGSDVPFALIGGTAYGTGRGELVEPLADATELWWLVVPSEIGLSTPQVYRTYDEIGPADAAGDDHPAELIAALASGDVAALIGALRNDLTAAAYALRHDLSARVGDLRGLLGEDATVLLSGSGPTQLVPYAGVDAARDAAARLSEAGIAHWLAPAPVAGVHVVSYA